MNLYDLTGYLFIGGIAYAIYKKFSPFVKTQNERLMATSAKNKEYAEYFLDNLSSGQLMQVKTWMNHKGISSSLMDSIGLEKYIALTDGGIALTLEMCPFLFDEAMKRKV